MHIYDSRFPIASSARLRPPDASVDDYRRLQERLGTTRAVVVTPSTYGTDNRCTLAAIAKFGSSARGIAVVDTDVTRLELEQMAAAGIRGIRFNLKVDTTITSSMIEPLAGRIGDFGWHVQVNMRPDTLIASESLLNRLRVPIVFDHLAHIPPEPGIEHPAFRAVCRLIDKGNTWVKLSGAYLDSRVGPPSYSDVGSVARAFVEHAPERIVWGSDWPHPTEPENGKPDDGLLFDLLTEWAPDASTQQRVLVENPAILYGFS